MAEGGEGRAVAGRTRPSQRTPAEAELAAKAARRRMKETRVEAAEEQGEEPRAAQKLEAAAGAWRRR